ncbi:hypothetical protein D9M71_339590 [compost metagenome]
MPLLAVTGSRLAAMMTVRNIGLRAARLAMRSVSTAEAKPMVVKLGMTRKPTVFTGRCSFAERPAAGFATWSFAIITAPQLHQ